MIVPTYSQVHGPSYTYDPATISRYTILPPAPAPATCTCSYLLPWLPSSDAKSRISLSPLLPDPWEATMVEVQPSKLEQVRVHKLLFQEQEECS